MPRAILDGTVIAEADQTVIVEGNHYFPPRSIDPDHLRASSSRTICPWKGMASYHDVIVNGSVHRDAGWSYPRPSPLARRIRGYAAFDGRVVVEPTQHDLPRPRFLDRFRRQRSTPTS